jgi:hypothetical protein
MRLLTSVIHKLERVVMLGLPLRTSGRPKTHTRWSVPTINGLEAHFICRYRLVTLLMPETNARRSCVDKTDLWLRRSTVSLP